jgi:PAS domain S-box-containing protein/putative nucleotidyltransferase with HDIG domain
METEAMHPLAVLFIDESPDDVNLVINALSQADYQITSERVATLEQFQGVFERQDWDIVLCEFQLPQFSALDVLARLHAAQRDIPLLVVTNTPGEENAVTMMRAGARDYLLKSHLSRLCLAVQREVEQVKIRRVCQETEEDLRIKNQLLNATGQMANVGGWQFDVVTGEGTWTDQVARIHGLNPAVLTNRSLGLSFYPPADRQKIEQAIARAVEAAVPYDLTLELVTAQGEHKWVRSIGYPVSKDGKVVQLTGIFQDITERIQADRTRRENEAHLLAVIENTEDDIIAVNRDLRLIAVNSQAHQALERLAGRQIGKREEVLGLIPPVYQADWKRYFERALGGEIFTFEQPLDLPSGLRYMEYRFHPIYLEDGAVDGVVVLGRNVTERKQKELERRQQREDLELINRLNQMVNQGESLEDLIQVMAGETRKIVSARDCAVYLLTQDEKFLIMQNYTLSGALIRKIEQIIGVKIPPVKLQIRPGSFFARILAEEKGTIVNDPALIQEWIQEFTETTYLSPALRKIISAAIPQIYYLTQVKSVITVPLISKGKTIGIMDVSGPKPFTQEDLARIRNISGQVTAAILRKRDEDALRQSELKYQKLTEISPVGIFHIGEDGLLTYVNQRLCQITGLSEQDALGDGYLKAVHPEDRERVDQLVQNLRFDSRAVSINHRYLRPDGSVAWVLGQLTPDFDAENTLVGYVGTITDITGLKEAEQRVKTQIARLRALRNIDISINSTHHIRHTLDILLEETMGQLGCDAANVLLLSADLQKFEFAARRGFFTVSEFNDTPFPVVGSYAGLAVTGQCMKSTPDAAHLNSNPPLARLWRNEAFQEYFCVPLIIKGQIKGVLELFFRRPFVASEEWIEFYNALAGQAAIAIDNAQLFENLQRTNSELTRAYETTIEGWSHALDLRDHETEGHTLRVSEMAERLARAVGMNEADLLHFRRGALLHDIGKLGVPDGILLKPDALTPSEWAIMRQHPQFAYDMLYPIEYLRPALDIPYCHHEKWDGSGYPRGLRGEEIPLAARLFAVVDVWDALCSDRPYRSGWPEAEVLEYLRVNAGKHFDPHVVEIFLAMINDLRSSPPTPGE